MEQSWLEVRIDTTAAGIEPVSAWLTALGIVGLVVEEAADFEQFADENRASWDEVDDDLKAERSGVNRVKCYLTDDEEGRAWLSELRAGLPALRARTGADLGALALTTVSLREEDWAHNWQKYYEAFPVGERLYIVPEWERGKLDIPAGRTPVYLNPGQIFGTGSHGTTRLCLEGVERYVVPGAPVLDLGCGSGILAIAALLLGASEAKGCDIDHKAVAVAAENAGFNGVADRLAVYCGDVTGDARLAAQLAGQYPLVLANIIADVIIPLSAHVGQFLTPDGVFLCSGIIAHRADDVRNTLESNGFAVLERQEREGWVSFAAKKR
ncbi:MAG: 50S ribosomal protein L11 methyltransferase [Oscillospiraceae bacterium]|nr:50S ribosomal protein L11 methyltransferase [Oscillospiraceae bacterium]